MTFELEVNGCSGTYPGPGRACSGYLLRTTEARVVVDLGNGSSSNLLKHTPVERIDAIVITHHHADHCVDLIGMYYALRFHDAGPRTVDVYAPAGTAEHLAKLLSSDASETFLETCRFHEVGPGDELEVVDLRLSFHESVHPVPTLSLRAQHDGRALAYSADSAGGPQLVAAARDADLFLCEATWPLGADRPTGVHMDPTEAAVVAREADVGRLVLTHLWPPNDRAAAEDAARQQFHGDVALADDGQVWRLG